MKIKKLIELLEVIEGKLPQDMYELGSYTRQNGGWIGIDDMDFIHVMRAFEKMQLKCKAAVPLDTATAYFAPTYLAISFSNSSIILP